LRGRIQKAVLDEHRAITVRQHYGRAAARALGTYLHTLGTGTLKCRVVTQVSKPNEVFDTYGRFIGDLIVGAKNGQAIDSTCGWPRNRNMRRHAFLATAPSQDRCYKTEELLEQGITVPKQYDLAELVADARMKFKPGDLVFQEAAATLVDARNRKVVGW
jgi:hypothetical protein